MRYEYKVVSILDGNKIKTTGRVPVEELTTQLNELGAAGWHVVGSYASPHNTTAGIELCENVLVFERPKEWI